jgi:hypothetical protein
MLYNPEVLKVKPLYEKYQAEHNTMNLGYRNVKRSILTPKIQDSNKSRSKILKAIRYIVKGNTHHYLQNTADAALKLDALINRDGDITTMPIYHQTGIINILVEELSNTYKPYAMLIHVDDLVSELKRENEEFDTLSKKVVQEHVEKNDVVIKVARRHLDDAYKSVIRRAEAFAEIDGMEKYSEFFKAINIIVAKYAKSYASKPKEETEEPVANNEEPKVEPKETVKNEVETKITE